jgi:type-F conjugative transfer system pilin assembly protein TrbC
MSNICYAEGTHIFISFSMPKTSIKQWLEQGAKANAQVYLRGFVKDSFKETIIESSEIIDEGSPGFLLDPKMFEKYKIEKVPAVVFEEKGQEPIIVYGDIGLLAAAEAVHRVTDNANAEKVISYLKHKS